MRAARGGLMALGLGATAYGALLLARLDLADLLDVALWLIGGAVLHDAVVAPLTIAATLLLLRVLPVAWRTVTTVALVVLLGVTATAVPVLGRFGARPDNPTLLDRDYVSGWLLLAAGVLLVAAVAQLLSRGRGRAAPPPPGGSPRRRC